MKPEAQIKALAELDGWTMHKVYPHVMCYYEGKRLIHESDIEAPRLSRYLTSYDAIIPLIQKQQLLTRLETGVQLAIMRRQLFGYPTQDNVEGWIMTTLTATPAQLCEALLRSTGKWTE